MDPMLHAQLKDWVPMAGLLLIIIWGFSLVTIGLRKKHQSEMQKALLEKFSSAHDFAEFMQSPAGQKYMMSFTDAVTSPRQAIIKTVQIGIVLLFAGFGLQNAHHYQLWLLDTLGLLLMFLGIGFLISSVVSYFMAKKMDSGVKE